MFVCSTKSPKKVFHRTDCNHAIRIKKQNATYFDSFEKARAAGYTQCSCCSQMSKHYYREQEQIKKYCNKTGMKYFQYDGALYIISIDDVAWRIVQGGHSKTTFFLQHESLLGNSYLRCKTPYQKRAFHNQKIRCDTIVAYMEYIHDHDVWLQSRNRAASERFHNEPRYTKKERKRMKRQKNQRRFQDANGVLTMLNSMNEDYSMPQVIWA